MSLPKVTLILSNGNLLADISAIDGIAGIIGTVTGALIGTVKTVYSLEDAEEQGYTVGAAPAMHRHIKEFYSEVGGNQELWLQGVAETMSMAQMLDNTSATGAKKMIVAAGGKIRLLGVCRKPAGSYDGGDDFMDADVSAALTASNTFGAARLAELAPLRILIEGRIADETSVIILEPKEADANYAGVVLGGTLNDGSASVGLALGRAVKYPAEVKLGKVANGPLSATAIFIGTKALKDVANLATLHGNGFISFMQHPNKAGFYFGIDRMASTGDYRLLTYGRVIDKAAVIAAAVYINELESEIDIDGDGRMNELDVEHLKGTLEQQVKLLMGNQISNFRATIDPTQNITATGKLEIKARVQPKGYASFIEVDLGLNAPA